MAKSGYIFLYIFIISLIFINFGYAGDLYIEERVSGTITGDNITDTRKILIKDNNVLITDPSLAYKTLFKFNDKKAFLIDDLNKRYSVINMDNFRVPVKEKFVSVFELFNKSDARYKESGNKRVIGKYNCFEVMVFLPRAGALINLWLTKEIDAPLDLYFLFMDKVKMESSQIGHIVKIMREYGAYAVECLLTMVAEGKEKKYFKIELKEISGGEIPNSEFSIPEEYSRFVLK